MRVHFSTVVGSIEINSIILKVQENIMLLHVLFNQGALSCNYSFPFHTLFIPVEGQMSFCRESGHDLFTDALSLQIPQF